VEEEEEEEASETPEFDLRMDEYRYCYYY